MSVSLAIVKDTSLNVRRDFIEEKELTIKQGLKRQILNALKPATPVMLDFTFSVVTDDGNLQSALLAGAHDLVQQAGVSDSDVWSCLLMHYDNPAGGKWIIDPTFEEQNNLSNNLVLITLIKRGDEERAIVDKGLDILRTSFPVQ